MQAQALTGRTGHVERTNDRDYEVEERYKMLYLCNCYKTNLLVDDTAQWSPQRTAYRKKQRDTWTLCGVSTTR